MSFNFFQQDKNRSLLAGVHSFDVVSVVKSESCGGPARVVASMNWTEWCLAYQSRDLSLSKPEAHKR